MKKIGLFCCALLSGIVYSQEFKVNQLGWEQGLVSPGVYDMVFDESYFLWFATGHGICKYNGYSLENCNQTTGWPVATVWIRDLEMDLQHNLWIIAEDTCLLVCKDKNRSTRSFLFFPQIHDPVKVVFDGDRTWAVNYTSIFEIYNSRVINTYPLPEGFRPLRRNSSVILNNNIFIGSYYNGLICFDLKTKTFTNHGEAEGLPSHEISSVHLDKGRLFILYDQAIYKYVNGKYQFYFSHEDSPFIRHIFTDSHGQTWICGERSIAILKDEKLVYFLSPKNSTFTDVAFYQVQEDREGNYWLGSGERGIFQIRNTFLTHYANPEKKNDPIYGTSQDSKGANWLGNTERLEVVRMNEKENGTHVFDTIKIPTNPELSLYNYLNDEMWFTGRQGIARIKDGSIKFYGLENIVDDFVWQPFLDPGDSSVYFPGYRGVTRFKNEKFIKLEYPEDPSTSHIFIYDGVATRHGIYLGTNHGIKKLENSKYSNIPELPGDEESLIIKSDKFQNVWVNLASGNQILKFNVDKEGHIKKKVYDLYNAFGIKGPFNFYINEKYFILRSFDHLFVLDIDQLENEKIKIIAQLDQYEGLKPEEPAFSEGFLDSENVLWFGGGHGLFRYDFLKQIINQKQTFNHITSIRLNGEILGKNQYSKGTDSTVDELPLSLTIPFNKNEVTFDYFALTYSGHEKVFYRTRLLGLNESWSNPSRDRHITYNNLSPGKYTFQLISCNNDGVWNSEPYSFSFTILPPWYQTLWFRLLMALTLAGLIYFIFMLRINRLRKQKERQERLTQAILQSQEDERKRIAQDLHDGVGQELSMLKVGAEKEKNEFITTKVNKIIEDIRALSRNIHPHYFEKLGLTKAAEMLVEEGKQLGSIYWVHELENIDSYFESKEQLMIFRIVQECMNNIIKHSEAKNAKVSFEKIGRQVHITINDNGVGFNMDSTKLKSLGLSTIKERVRSLNGNLNIKSKPGQGTQTSIILPISKK